MKDSPLQEYIVYLASLRHITEAVPVHAKSAQEAVALALATKKDHSATYIPIEIKKI